MVMHYLLFRCPGDRGLRFLQLRWQVALTSTARIMAMHAMAVAAHGSQMNHPHFFFNELALVELSSGFGRQLVSGELQMYPFLPL